MKTVSLLVSVIFLLPCLPALAAAEEVTVTELLEESRELSEREVSVEGELVGDFGFRDDGSMWTQLNGDVYVLDPILEGGDPAGANIAVGVRIPIHLTGDLSEPGSYHFRGPFVRLTGVWKHHDPDRQGESFLDVESLEMIQPARPLDEEAAWWTWIAGLGLLLAAGALWFLGSRPDRS